MTDSIDWQGRVGQAWAAEWRRTDRSFAGLTDRLLGRASARPVTRALDVGCGAGELSLALARGHSGVEIVGLDLSESLIDVARERGAHLPNVTFGVADAARWSRPGFAPDLIVSRHGVMFFDDPVAAFSHLARTAAPDARLVFSCFRDVTLNPWAERIVSFLPADATSFDESDRHAPGPFAFADRAYVERILSQAGWMDVAFEEVDFAYVAGSGEDPIGDALSYFLTIGPAARAATDLDDGAKATFLGKLRRYLENSRTGSIVALRAAAWIVTARPAHRR